MSTPLFYKLYLLNLLSKLELLEKGITQLKADYSLARLEKMHRELHDLSQDMKLFGDEKKSQFLKECEMDMIVKIKNFYYDTNQLWLNHLEEFVGKLKKHIDQIGGINPVDREKRKVVIVDDDEDILKLLVHEFRELGFEVETFKLGKEALAFLSNEKNIQDVFLLILDRILPDMDGLDVLRAFSKSKKKIPTLILSVLSSESDILSGLQDGAVDYIAKPFSVFFLVQKALNLLKTEQ